MSKENVAGFKWAWGKALDLDDPEHGRAWWAGVALKLGMAMSAKELASCQLCETYSDAWQSRIFSNGLAWPIVDDVGDLMARAAKLGVLKSESRKDSPMQAPLAFCAQLGEAMLSGPEMWDNLFCANMDVFDAEREVDFDDATGRFMALIPTSAARARSGWIKENTTAEMNNGWVARWPRMSEQVKALYPELLDRAVSAGLLEHLGKSARGGVWALHCALAGNIERLREAVDSGIRLDKISHGMALGYLKAFIRSSHEGARAFERKYGSAGNALSGAALEKDMATKKEAWDILVKAGLPRVEPEAPLYWTDCRALSGAKAGTWDCVDMMKSEARRGGFVTGEGLYNWGVLALGATLEHERIFEGATPLAWAFGASMKASDWTHGALEDLAAHAGEGCRIDALLGDLAAAGVRLGPREAALTRYGRGMGERESLVARLVQIGASAEGLMSAAKIGVDMRELGSEGTPPLEALFELNRTGRYAERAKGLIDGAEAAEKGGAAKLLSMRGRDGSAPMHWAARALCAQSVEILAKLGESATEKDEKGRSPGHWAAKKYGHRGRSKMGATLKALTLAGADWSALDAKGVSAMAALASRGPLEAVADLLEAAPEALWAKSGGAKSAMEVMGAREPRALALAERVALGSGSEKESQDAPKPRKQRL